MVTKSAISWSTEPTGKHSEDKILQCVEIKSLIFSRYLRFYQVLLFIISQDRNLVARLYETLRCVQAFDKQYDYDVDDIDGERSSDISDRLIRSLQEDYRCRSPYLSYLVRCRQGLASALAQQERHQSRCAVDRQVCSASLVSVCIRQFLEQRHEQMAQFVAQVQFLWVKLANMVIDSFQHWYPE